MKRTLLIGLVLVLYPFLAQAFDSFPTADEMREKKKAVEENDRQCQIQAEEQARKRQAQEEKIAADTQIEKLKDAILRNPRGPIYWNRSHDQGALFPLTQQFLQEKNIQSRASKVRTNSIVTALTVGVVITTEQEGLRTTRYPGRNRVM